MASFRLLTRGTNAAASTTLLLSKKLLFAPPVSNSIRRANFNTKVYSFTGSYDEYRRSDSHLSRHRVHDFFSDGGSGGVGKDWEVKENNESMKLRFDMPGLEKDDVKVSVVRNLMLVIDAAESERKESEEEPIHYFTKIIMDQSVFNLTNIQAEMINGVLKLVVPRIKPEDWADAYEVEIE